MTCPERPAQTHTTVHGEPSGSPLHFTTRNFGRGMSGGRGDQLRSGRYTPHPSFHRALRFQCGQSAASCRSTSSTVASAPNFSARRASRYVPLRLQKRHATRTTTYGNVARVFTPTIKTKREQRIKPPAAAYRDRSRHAANSRGHRRTLPCLQTIPRNQSFGTLAPTWLLGWPDSL